MATYELIDSVVDAMVSSITTNIASLGGTATTPITEGDEEPHLVRVFPSIFIIPLIEGGDSISWKMGNVTHRFHEYTITVIGLYRTATVSEAMRTTRQYGYTLADLFSGTNSTITGSKGTGYVTGVKVDCGYFRVGDKIIHSWSVKFSLKSATV